MSRSTTRERKERSDRWRRGYADGQADRARMAEGREPIGPMPPDPAYPAMYNYGYEDGFQEE